MGIIMVMISMGFMLMGVMLFVLMRNDAVPQKQ